MNRFLRRILLFPLAVFMGIEGMEASTESSTESESDAGSVTGEAGSAGAQESTNGQDETGEANAAATESGSEAAAMEQGEQPGAGPDSLPANERFQQLIAKDKEKDAQLGRLEAKLQEIEHRTAQEKPNFVQVDMEKVNTYFQAKLDEIDQLRLQGRPLEALEIQDHLNEIRNQLKDNEQKKNEFISRTEQSQQHEQFVTQMNQRIVEASKLVMQDSGITPEVWAAGEKFFLAERSSKPLLDAQYRELVMLQGPIAALTFAKDYVTKNMGAKQQEATAAKETAKSAVPGGKTSASTSQSKDYKTMSDEEFDAEINRVKYGA